MFQWVQTKSLLKIYKIKKYFKKKTKNVFDN